MGVFIAFDCTQPKSLESALLWRQAASRLLSESIPVILLMTKCDLQRHPEIPTGHVMSNFCATHGFAAFFETSARNAEHQVCDRMHTPSFARAMISTLKCPHLLLRQCLIIFQGINEAFSRMIELLLPYAEQQQCFSLVRNSLHRSSTSISCTIPAPQLAHNVCLLSYFASTKASTLPACLPAPLLPAQRRLLLSFAGLACFFIRNIMPKDARRNEDHRKQLLLRLFNEDMPPRVRMHFRRAWTGLNSQFQKSNAFACDFRGHNSTFAEIQSINLSVSILCHHSSAFSRQISAGDAAWERDTCRLSCAAPPCGRLFSFVHRRHHCRCENVLLAMQAVRQERLTSVSCAGFVGC